MKLHLPFILTILFAVVSIVPVAFAQTSPPPPPESVASAKGTAVAAGWNYFTIGFDGCTAQRILDELQADAGGAIAIESLFVQTGDGWQEYASVNPDSGLAMINSGDVVAFSSSGRFYFDLAAAACQTPDEARDAQILGLRAAAKNNVNSQENLLDKLVRIPQDFWTGLTGGFKFGKADGNLEFNKAAVLDRLTVADQTNLGPTAVAGPLTVGATLIEEDGAISSLGCDRRFRTFRTEGSEPASSCVGLKFQPNAFSNIEFLGGKVLLTKSGDLQINSGHIAGNSSFRGSVSLAPGQGSLRIDTSWETEPVTITATPTWNTAVWVEDLSASGFTIRVSSPPPASATAKNSRLFWLALW